MLKLYKDSIEENQVGVDEVGRGCFSGPVVAGAVLWDSNWLAENKDVYEHLKWIKDSKKMTQKRRTECSDFIKKHCKIYSISHISAEEIDEKNILNAAHEAMHNCIDQIHSTHTIDRLLVDGISFKPYKNKHFNIENISNDSIMIPHTCEPQGDNKYLSIASASILAKVERDTFMISLCNQFPEFQEKYDWINNKGYGTPKHIQGIREHGLSVYHRRTFGMCKNID